MTTATVPVTVTFGTFDLSGGRDVLRIHRQQPLGDFKSLAVGADYDPHGSTPLRDAVADFIAALDEQRQAQPDSVTIGLLADESGSMRGKERAVVDGFNDFVRGMSDVDQVDQDASGKVLCVIFTDGYENASRKVSPEQLRELIVEREADGWTFIYMGANQDAWAVGTSHGFSGGVTGQTVSYVDTAVGTHAAFAAVTSDASSYLSDNKRYLRSRAGSSARSIDESGAEKAPVKKQAPESDALSRAKNALKS